MRLEPVTPARFEKLLAQLQKRTARAARGCLAWPTPEAIHEFRIAIRKMKAGLSLAPKELRRDKKTVNYVRALDELYADCAGIRDIDTMVRTLSADRAAEATKAIAAHLTKRRSVLVRRVVDSASEIVELSLPKPATLQSGRLGRRLRRIVGEKTEKAIRLYQASRESEERVNELHKLRKECRRIMYLLDFVKDRGDVAPIKEELEDARQRLGSIREDDVLLDLLSGLREGPYDGVFNRVTAARREKYAEFFRNQSRGRQFLVRRLESLT